jgi:hypothetical protein
MVRAFVEEEYVNWPFCEHDDMLDSLARIHDPNAGMVWPKESRAGYLPFLGEERQPPLAVGTGEVQWH